MIEVANRIQGSIRETDTAARLAGDEFVVIMENIQALTDAEQVALKILSALSNQASPPDSLSRISASIGISVFPDHGNDSETLLRSADRAMYDAKTLGRNRLNIGTDAGECAFIGHRQRVDNGNVN